MDRSPENMTIEINQQLQERGTHWRTNAFTSSWLLYAGYYLCRKDLRAIQLMKNSPADLGNAATLLFVFGLAYTLGHLIAGFLADKFSARKTALIGGLLSAASTASMVHFSSPRTFLILQFLNGFGQGCGFPALAKLLMGWFTHKERPVVLAWWTASYSLGGVLASNLAIWFATTPFLLPGFGWKRAFLLPSLLLALLSVYFYFTTKENPEQIGIPPIQEPISETEGQKMGWRLVFSNPHLQTIGAMYFFLKMTRYALLFWLPLYLIQATHYSENVAFSTSSLFELFGFVGALLATHLSARYFRSRRYPVATIFLFALGFLALLEPMISTLGWWAGAVSISLMGLLVYGVDALMVSVAVLENVPYTHAGRSIAAVNGAGSVGQTIAPILVTAFAHYYGWDNLFNLFLITSLIAAVIVAPRWNQSNLPIESRKQSGTVPVAT